MSANIEIVDHGRGPQLSTSRITVLDVFYYLRRGRDWEAVHQAMPSLSRAEFDAVLDYVNQHRAELDAKDRLVEQRIQQAIAEQKAKGLYHEIDESVPVEERAARLRNMLPQHAGKNGDSTAR